MRYVVSAQEYFGSINENQSNIDKLQAYFESIPQTFWSALESIDLSPLSEFKPIKRTQSEEQILEHQLFLFDQADDFASLVKNEDFLVRLGYDTVALREQGEYFEKIETLNESVLSSIWNFITALVEDPDPVEMTLNVIRLILDIIGLIPFTWALVPIDVVANILSAMISLYKGEYLSMTLSLLAAVDVTQASDALKFALKGLPRPIMTGFERLIKILCRSGKDARAVENGILALREEVMKLGGSGIKGVFDLIIKILSGIAGFISNTVVMVLRTATSFVDKALSYVPVAGKYLGQTTRLLDNIVLAISDIGRNFDTAAKTIEKGGAGADAKIARTADDLRAAALRTADTKAARSELIKQAQADARAAGLSGDSLNAAVSKRIKEFDEPIYDLYTTKPGYLADLTKEVKDSAKYAHIKETLGAEYADAYLKAKVENEFIGQVKRTTDIVLGDKELAEHLASLGWAPDGLQLIELARKGDTKAVKNFFEVFLTDAKISKSLSNTEIRAFTPFAANPEAFIIGVKNMDKTVKQLTMLEKVGGITQRRTIPFKRILSLLFRLAWQRYGSLECIMLAGAQSAGDKVIGATNKMAAGFLQKAVMPTNENDQESTNQSTEKPEGDALSVLNNELKKNDQLKEDLAKKQNDCNLTAAGVNANVGAQVNTDFPGSTAGIADGPGGKADLEKANEYTKRVLSSLQLDSNIDAQHAIEATDPVIQLQLAPVYDRELGLVSLKADDTLAMEEAAKQMEKEGIYTKEEIQRALIIAKKKLADGEMDEIPLPKNRKANESLLKVKSLFN